MTKETGVYVCRKVKNADELIAWAKEQGFKSIIVPEDLHVTVAAYSRKHFDPSFKDSFDSLRISGGKRTVEPLGKDGAVVLKFESKELSDRWQEFKDAGASWDYPEYQPHVTLTYSNDVDISKVDGYKGSIELGPEIVEKINDSWSDDIVEKIAVLKLDDEERMVYGWASVISNNGEPVIDTQGDIIDAADLVKSTTEFMQDQMRTSKEMHVGKRIGMVVHSFPLTAEIAKSLGVTCEKEGWLVGVKVLSDETWQRVKKGELKAFSIGVNAIRREV